MKKLAIILALLCIDWPAHAGGICNDSLSSPATLGTTETTPFTQPIAGGAIPLGNSLEVFIGGIATHTNWSQSANAYVFLNDVELGNACFTGASDAGWLELRIHRTGNTTGTVYARRWNSEGGEEGYAWDVEGLSWTTQQTLAVKGQSNLAGGASLRSVCVRR